jgi:hypothetical protein
MKFPMVPPDDVLTGMQLTADEVGALEQRLEGAPGDLMTRSQLLGYYAGAMLASLEAAQHLERHALWLIENAPDAEVTGCAFCGVGDAQQFARAESLWRGHLERRPDDPRILTHAARFLQYSKPELAEELIVRARKVDPSGDWSLHEVPEFEPPASIAPTPVAETACQRAVPSASTRSETWRRGRSRSGGTKRVRLWRSSFWSLLRSSLPTGTTGMPFTVATTSWDSLLWPGAISNKRDSGF